MTIDRYHQRRALGSDAGSSVVYLFNASLQGSTRDIVRLQLLSIGDQEPMLPKRQSGRLYPPRIYCEAIFNDEAYRRKYGAVSTSGGIAESPVMNTVVVGSWYRDRLGSNAPNARGELRIVELGVSVVPSAWYHPWRWWAAIWLSLRHPVSTNRVATYLGVVGVILGLIGLLLGVISVAVATASGPTP